MEPVRIREEETRVRRRLSLGGGCVQDAHGVLHLPPPPLPPALPVCEATPEFVSVAGAAPASAEAEAGVESDPRLRMRNRNLPIQTPTPPPLPAPTLTHTVREGDTRVRRRLSLGGGDVPDMSMSSATAQLVSLPLPPVLPVFGATPPWVVSDAVAAPDSAEAGVESDPRLRTRNRNLPVPTPIPPPPSADVHSARGEETRVRRRLSLGSAHAQDAPVVASVAVPASTGGSVHSDPRLRTRNRNLPVRTPTPAPAPAHAAREEETRVRRRLSLGSGQGERGSGSGSARSRGLLSGQAVLTVESCVDEEFDDDANNACTVVGREVRVLEFDGTPGDVGAEGRGEAVDDSAHHTERILEFVGIPEDAVEREDAGGGKACLDGRGQDAGDARANVRREVRILEFDATPPHADVVDGEAKGCANASETQRELPMEAVVDAELHVSGTREDAMQLHASRTPVQSERAADQKQVVHAPTQPQEEEFVYEASQEMDDDESPVHASLYLRGFLGRAPQGLRGEMLTRVEDRGISPRVEIRDRQTSDEAIVEEGQRGLRVVGLGEMEFSCLPSDTSGDTSSESADVPMKKGMGAGEDEGIARRGMERGMAVRNERLVDAKAPDRDDEMSTASTEEPPPPSPCGTYDRSEPMQEAIFCRAYIANIPAGMFRTSRKARTPSQ